MTRKEYLDALESRLGRLTQQDRDDALAYYLEIFEDRGVEEEDSVPEDMPDPRQASFEILRDDQLQRMEENEKAETNQSQKKEVSLLFTVVLAILALPIGLPIAIALLLVFLSAILAIGSLLIVGVGAGAGLVLGAIKELATEMPKAFSMPRALYLLGIVLLGVAVVLIMILVMRDMIRGIRKLLLRQKNKRGAQHE